MAVNGKAQTKGHVVPGNCRFSLGIDVLRVLKTDLNVGFHATIAAEAKRSFYFLFLQPRKGGFDLFVK